MGAKFKKLLHTRLPITQWLPHYTFSKLLQDFLAGFTVALTEIPQTVAYATLAGLPPEYGLYSGLLDGFIYALTGGCKDLNVGPSSILSLLLQLPVARFGMLASPLMTFISGCVIFLLGVLHLGFVTNFFSYPVIAGFVCSGCLQIGVGQFKSMFGISGPSDNLLQTVQSLVTNFTEIRLWDSVLGIVSILFLVFMKEVQVFYPKNFLGKVLLFVTLSRCALALIIGTLISTYFHDQAQFLVTGNVTGGFPSFEAPSFWLLPDLAPVYGVTVAFVPLLSLLEIIATTRAFSKGTKLDSTQEMLALGLCNIIGSFIGSMPVTGSFSRSAVNNASGVKTTLGGVFTSVILILVIAFLTPTFYYVPKASLCAILITAIIYIIDYRACVLFWKTNKTDFIPFLTTFLVGIFYSVEYGTLIGTAVNLLFILYGSARPKFQVVEEKVDSEIYTITPKDTLYYPAAEFLRDKAADFEGQNVTVKINGAHINNMDTTVAKSVAALTKDLLLENHKIFFVDFKDSIRDICLGIDKKLEEHFVTEEDFQRLIKDQQVAVISD